MAASASLAAAHDVLLVDLDGTLRLAGKPIPHAADSLAGAGAAGSRAVIVTNNPSKSPTQIADSLRPMGFEFDPRDVVTSAQVAGTMLAASHPRGAAVLVVGTDALCDAVSDVGLTPVRSADAEPVAVVQGHSPTTGWADLAEACIAIRRGADWVATNTDPTLPTDRGQLPGNGSMVAALVTATGRRPRVAGKPGRELIDAAIARAEAHRPLVVGDRLDTDIAAANAAGVPGLLVLTGVSTAADLLAAEPELRPQWVAADLRGLVLPRAVARLRDLPAGDEDRDAPWAVSATGDALELRSTAPRGGPAVSPGGPAGEAQGSLTALAALADAAWRTGITVTAAADEPARAALAALALD